MLEEKKGEEEIFYNHGKPQEYPIVSSSALIHLGKGAGVPGVPVQFVLLKKINN
jgi:hypothetical protein